MSDPLRAVDDLDGLIKRLDRCLDALVKCRAHGQASLMSGRVFRAVFAPQRLDDLRPGTRQFIGTEALWQCAWIIEEGPYAGEWACQIVSTVVAPFAWAPESDLRIRSEDCA